MQLLAISSIKQKNKIKIEVTKVAHASCRGFVSGTQPCTIWTSVDLGPMATEWELLVLPIDEVYYLLILIN